MKKTVPAKPLKRPTKRPSAKKSAVAVTKKPTANASPFPIVGIGASAGGLEALVQFLEHCPVTSGMAFVIVQHLDPTQKGMMPELLQRATKMKVAQVKDRTRVRPDHVYVIPPNSDLSILQGVLHLLVPVATRGLRLPIDFFFRSLADDRHEQSVGIILSGMGSDGTLGLRAIKEKAGIALAQDPTTAKFDAMPRNCIDAGLVDFVAPAGELPEKLVAFFQHRPQISRLEPLLDDKAHGSLDKIVILLRQQSGHDFSMYRRSTLYRRVERRMGIHQLAGIADYVRYVQNNPQERGILFKEMLIGVTTFFRDTETWESLAKQAIPTLLANHTPGAALRAWVTGCSTGEEAYTLAMVFIETLKRMKLANDFTLQIYATDLDKDAIAKARQGFYSRNIASDVSAARLTRFFKKEPNGYRVNKEIRSMVIFAPQNLIMDPPFTKLDILCCRNLLIYLTQELQRKLIPLFHYSLNPGGLLLLGSAESIGNFTTLFNPLVPKARIFQRGNLPVNDTQLEFPAVFMPAPKNRLELLQTPAQPVPSLKSLVDQMLQARFAPPAVLVNQQGDIIYVHGRTGHYLEPAAGQANWNIHAMARPELQGELSGALLQAIRKQEPVTTHGIQVALDGSTYSVDLSVEALTDPKPLNGLVLILFSENAHVHELKVAVCPPGAETRKTRHQKLEDELIHAREEMQANLEEMQTSQEELRSMNEELQSTNEELQSTNEELMTSKEEMQSLNEELQTVNAELQSKLDELSETNNDMKNLLNSTDIATVFLDNELCVRRFTLQAKTIIKFIGTDIGRPITDLASKLLYPNLVKDAQEVLRTLIFCERAIGTDDKRWFTVRIMPYRTMDNRIDGVVITFADITTSKNTEQILRDKYETLARHSKAQDRLLEIAQAEPPQTEHRSRVKSTPAKQARKPGAGPRKAKP